MSEADLSTFRRAYNPQLLRLCSSLAAWEAKPEGVEIYVPGREALQSTRLVIIQDEEIVTTPHPINPLQLRREETHQELRRRVPSLKYAQEVKAISLQKHTGHFGKQLLSLRLAREDRIAARDERTATRGSLIAIGDVVQYNNVRWQKPDPSVLVVSIAPDAVPEGFVDRLAGIFKKQLGLPTPPDEAVSPLNVTLGPAEFPTAQPSQ
jgi:hypothetical protein